jgi:hypothetical protein
VSEQEDAIESNGYIQAELAERLKRIEVSFDADVITLVHPIGGPFDDIIRQQMDQLQNKRADLLVILETEGGSIETTERIADVFRHHYAKGEVSFLIPNYAMSAGTILVMSGDRILMDYYSVLGPIDPQVQNSDGQWVPGMGYLEKFKEFVAKSKKGSLSPAELAFLLDKFDPAHLHWLEQAREHGVDLLEKWLVQYKFKDWNETEDRKIPVTPKMKADRARKIAANLNNTKIWRSHGRGLSLNVIRRSLNLKIEDYGTEEKYVELNKLVTAYYRLLKDFMARRGWVFAVQTRDSSFMR